jgi:hypothetical protein
MGERVAIRKSDGTLFEVNVPDAWGRVMLYERRASGAITAHTESGNRLHLHPDSSKAAERWLREYLSRVDRRAEARSAEMLWKALNRD